MADISGLSSRLLSKNVRAFFSKKNLSLLFFVGVAVGSSTYVRLSGLKFRFFGDNF